MSPKISIIIPTLNEELFIGDLLGDLQNQTLFPSEVLIIDGNSTDKTADVVGQFPFATLIRSKSGVGHQRERGARRAKSELLVFFDADVRLSADFLEKVLHQLTIRQLEAAVPIYRSQKAAWYVRLVYHFFNWIFKFGEKIYPGGGGSCMICTKNVWQRVGGFHTELLCDDLDFINRIGKSSRFAVIPVIINVSDRRWRHYGYWSTIGKYCQISWHYIRGDLARTNAVEYEFGAYTKK